MATNAPNDPQSGEDVLPWAREITRYVRQIAPRASKDILPNVGTAGTSYELRRQPRDESPAVKRTPFEAYVIGIGTEEEPEALTVKVEPGSVVAGAFFNGGIEISNETDEFTLTPEDNILWLEATFNLAGEITDLQYVTGSAWTDFPNLSSDFGTDGNEWYHPIAVLRAVRADEAARYFTDKILVSLTSTHLVSQRQCIGGVMIWTLVPGPGGII